MANESRPVDADHREVGLQLLEPGRDQSDRDDVLLLRRLELASRARRAGLRTGPFLGMAYTWKYAASPCSTATFGARPKSSGVYGTRCKHAPTRIPQGLVAVYEAARSRASRVSVLAGFGPWAGRFVSSFNLVRAKNSQKAHVARRAIHSKRKSTLTFQDLQMHIAKQPKDGSILITNQSPCLSRFSSAPRNLSTTISKS